MTTADDQDAPTPPAPLREFTDDLLADDEVTRTFADTIEVPSRFDRDSPTATWRFDGTLTVRVEE